MAAISASPILDPHEQARFHALAQQTYRKVFSMAYRLAGNRPEAEDLTQEAYYRAYRSFRDFEGDRPFENWIFRIVTRLFLDLLRTKRRRVQTVSFDTPTLRDGAEDIVQVDLPDSKPSAEQQLMQTVLNEDLLTVLLSLPDEQRILVVQADIEQIPYQELAERYNKPIGTIRSRLHRAHKAMRRQLIRIRETRTVSQFP